MKSSANTWRDQHPALSLGQLPSGIFCTQPLGLVILASRPLVKAFGTEFRVVNTILKCPAKKSKAL
ncbi:hypothetical protein A2U01_0056752 [Trifolium medium]|uniref:Uncharacterized protein n=1 Tax=Trifolium medium TaxID=97028 RepID=A0A392RG34_9FABA|nr:hypothetical protein [Trifolium medium]